MSLASRDKVKRYIPWVTTLGGYGFSQVVIALGSIVRIPLLISALGPDGYGIIVAVSGVGVLFLAVADGLAQATRSICAENIRAAREEYSRFALLAFGALASCWILLAAAYFICWLVGISASVLAAFACLLGASFAILGGPSRGYMEATGRTGLTALLQTSTVLVGLPLLALTLHFSSDVVFAAAATGVGVALPALACVLFCVSTSWRADLGTAWVLIRTRPHQLLSRVRLAFSMVLFSWANSLNYSFDAAIVLATLGPVFAGEFGLASRIMTLGMMMSLALNPLVSSYISRWRSELDGRRFKSRVIRITCYMGALGLVSSVVGILIGPTVAHFLSQGQVVVPLSMFVALAVFSVLSALSGPLFAVFSGALTSRYRANASVIFGAANFCLSIGLSYKFGISGPAWSSCFCLAGLSMALLLYWRKWPSRVTTRHD